jgi:brefeldin A-resistance guanine nucleotide exchange factor 1
VRFTNCNKLFSLLILCINYRDRVNTLWEAVKQHLYNLITGAIEHNHMFLLERTVVGLMRLASRLMRREEISSMVYFLLIFTILHSSKLI